MAYVHCKCNTSPHTHTQSSVIIDQISKRNKWKKHWRRGANKLITTYTTVDGTAELIFIEMQKIFCFFVSGFLVQTHTVSVFAAHFLAHFLFYSFIFYYSLYTISFTWKNKALSVREHAIAVADVRVPFHAIIKFHFTINYLCSAFLASRFGFILCYFPQWYVRLFHRQLYGITHTHLHTHCNTWYDRPYGAAAAKIC